MSKITETQRVECQVESNLLITNFPLSPQKIQTVRSKHTSCSFFVFIVYIFIGASDKPCGNVVQVLTQKLLTNDTILWVSGFYHRRLTAHSRNATLITDSKLYH